MFEGEGEFAWENLLGSFPKVFSRKGKEPMGALTQSPELIPNLAPHVPGIVRKSCKNGFPKPRCVAYRAHPI